MTSCSFVSPWQLSMAGKRRSHQSSTWTLNQHLLHLLLTFWNITDSPSNWVLLPSFTIFYHPLPFCILCLIIDQGLPESKITFTPTSLDVMLLEAPCTAYGFTCHCIILYSLSLSICTYMYHTCYFDLFCIYMLPYWKAFLVFCAAFFLARYEGHITKTQPLQSFCSGNIRASSTWSRAMGGGNHEREREREKVGMQKADSRTRTHTHKRMQAQLLNPLNMQNTRCCTEHWEVTTLLG